MPSELSSYLATHYLTPDSKPPSKKRKRNKAKSGGSGLLIQDDDDEDWTKTKKDDEDDLVPVAVGKVKEFRKTTKANWKSLGGSSNTNDDSSAAAADAILASAAAEAAAARAAEDDAPVVEDVEMADAASASRMADGTHAGLQSAATVTAQLRRRQREERAQFEAERRAGLVQDGDGEASYRDATGKRVDVSMKRAEARKAALEAEDKERAKKEALKGEVQVEEAKRRRERLEDAKTMAFARGVDDEEVNREMKEQQRWNDPMAQFLGEKDQVSGAVGGSAKGSKKSGRPIYTGAAPPNRYGIRPGYRWDGVDRSNGFEAERFKALNRRERNKGLEYAWQMDE